MTSERWSEERINRWYTDKPWLVGCNFIPSYAVNQLEMWGEKSFNPEIIERELGWAADLGMNSVRVYLHDLLWEDNPEKFKSRVNRFLAITQDHGITTIFVFFDDCWMDNPQLGKQPEPIPGVHNSGWAQSPGSKIKDNPNSWGRHEDYICDILESFSEDERILLWDLYNEVSNYFLPFMSQSSPKREINLLIRYVKNMFMSGNSFSLLRSAFQWARAINPAQPITAGIWSNNQLLNRYLIDNSDIITFHNYQNLDKLKKQINELLKLNRLVICTEWMART